MRVGRVCLAGLAMTLLAGCATAPVAIRDGYIDPRETSVLGIGTAFTVPSNYPQFAGSRTSLRCGRHHRLSHGRCVVRHR
jgi:hypothetical protein